MGLETCRVVLVRPHIAANVGATARIMRNMGLRDLVLVAPECDPLDPAARQLSTQAEYLLHQARLVPDLGAGLAGCVLVAGTSARIGGLFRRQTRGAPEDIVPALLDALPAGPVALVFGPEPSGLTNDELTLCHHLIHIPADPGYPVLNLAQAAAICLYELRRAWLARAAPVRRAELAAPFEAQEQMFGRLQAALEAIHFLYGPKADALMHALRHMLGRAVLTPMEVDVLNGLARQIRWYVDHHG
jgi:tRNA/rRNA methyltransferase